MLLGWHGCLTFRPDISCRAAAAQGHFWDLLHKVTAQREIWQQGLHADTLFPNP